MLDQNTDRMMNVIMMVVIAAALMMLVSGSIPDIFASITDGYVEEVSDSPTPEPSGDEMTDGVAPTPMDENTIDARGMTLEEYMLSLVPQYPSEDLELVRTPYHAYYSTNSSFMNQYFSNTAQAYEMVNLHGTDFYKQDDPEGDVGAIKIKEDDRTTYIYLRNTLAGVERLERNTINIYSEYHGSEIRPVKLAYGTYYQLIIQYS